MAVGVGNGKILLFGEHAAVYGYPALGTSIPLQTRIEYVPGDDDVVFEGVPDEYHQRLRSLIERIGNVLHASKTRGRYSVSSTIPVGSGMGSSAALCAAIARVLSSGNGMGAREIDELWTAANEGEKLFHGTPSGIDTGLALRDGVYSFRGRSGGLPEAEEMPGLGAALLVATEPRIRPTGDLIADLAQRVRKEANGAGAALQSLGEVADNAIDLLKSAAGDKPSALGSLADTAHSTLDDLGLSTPAINRYLKEGRTLGALGGKISGAGGGGACFLLFPGTSAAHQAAKELKLCISAEKIDITIHGAFRV